MRKNNYFIIILLLGFLSYAGIGQAQFSPSVSRFPTAEGFEEDENDWNTENYSTTSDYGWCLVNQSGGFLSRWMHGGQGSVISRSYSSETYYDWDEYVLYYAGYLDSSDVTMLGFDELDFGVDNWLISPAISLPCSFGSASLSFYSIELDTGTYGDQFEVYLSSTGDTSTDMTTLLYSHTIESDKAATWEHHNISIPASYAGKTIYIGIRHKASTLGYTTAGSNGIHNFQRDFLSAQNVAVIYYYYTGIALDDFTLSATDPVYSYTSPAENVTKCDNQTPYTWTQNGQNYYTSSTYYDTTQYGGCDTIFTLILTVNETYNIPPIDTIGHRFAFKGSTYHVDKSLKDTLTTTKGCDSIITYNFTFIPDTNYFYDVVDSCSNTAVENKTAIISPYGYDSIVITHYTPRPIFLYSDYPKLDSSRIISSADTPFVWRNQSFYTSGTYYDSLKTAYNCDSIYRLTLIVRDTQYVASTIPGCDSVVYNAITYKRDTTFNDTTAHAHGLDTIYTTTIIVDTVEYKDSIVKFFSYSHKGQSYFNSQTFPIIEGACDSIRYTIDIPTRTIPKDSCILKKLNITSIENDTVRYTGNYDSLIITHYTVKPKFDDTIRDTATRAKGNLPYIWEGESIDTIATVTKAFTTTNNKCDSLRTLMLHVIDTNRLTRLDTTACDSAENILYKGELHTYYGDTILYDTIPHSNGIATVSIYKIHIDTSEVIEHLTPWCDFPYSWDSDFDGTLEDYQDTMTFLLAENGCDSIRIMPAIIHEYTVVCKQPSYQDSIIDTILETSIFNRPYSDCRTETKDTFLITHKYTSPSPTDTAVIYSFYYKWDNIVYDTAGTYFINDTNPNRYGCDSIVVKKIIINKTFDKPLQGCDRVTYKGTPFYKDTVFFDTIPEIDSIYRVIITVHKSEERDSFHWETSYEIDGLPYTASDTFYRTSQYGCDSTVHIYLAWHDTIIKEGTCTIDKSKSNDTIQPPDSITHKIARTPDTVRTTVIRPRTEYHDTLKITSSYYVFGSKTYSDEGDYIDTLHYLSHDGCDSIVTKLIAIRKTGWRSFTGCDSAKYTMAKYSTHPNRDSIYYADTSFVDTAYFGMNNDSILHVSIRILYSSQRDSVVWEPFYKIGDNTFFDPGSRPFKFTAANGCDSIVNMKLATRHIDTIDTCLYRQNSIVDVEKQISHPDGIDTLWITRFNVKPIYKASFSRYSTYYNCKGTVYTQEGTRFACIDTLKTVAGCDSIMTNNIIIINRPVIDTQGCDSVKFNGHIYFESITFDDTVRNATTRLLDSVRIIITIHKTAHIDSIVPIDSNYGLSYTVDGITYDHDSTFTYDKATSHLCDSLVTMHVIRYELVPHDTCISDSSSVRYDTSQVYIVDGEHYVVVNSYIVNPSKETEINDTVARATAWIENDTTYYVFSGTTDTIRNSGDSTFRFRTSQGCDSTVKIHVTFILSDPDTLCDTIYIYNTRCGVAKEREDTLFIARESELDSGHIKIHDTILITYSRFHYIDTVDSAIVSQMERFSDLKYFVWPNGDSIGQDGSYTARLSSVYGCDSTVTIRLLFIDTLRHIETNTICSTRDYDTTMYDTVNAAVTGRSRTNIYGTTYSYRTAIDSVRDTIGTSFSWNGTTFVHDATIHDTVKTATGCDSIYTIRFLVPREEERTIDTLICTLYLDSAKFDTITKTFFDTVNRTDTEKNITYETTLIRYYALFYHNYDTIYTSPTVWRIYHPANDSMYAYSLTSDTVIHDTLKTVRGCDSITSITFNVTCNTYGKILDTSVCAPFSYKGKTYDASTLIYDTLQGVNVYHCDSIRKIEATVHPAYYDDTVYLPTPSGGFRFLRTSYNDTVGTFRDTTRTVYGCDSTFVIIVDTTFKCDTISVRLDTAVCNNLYWRGEDRLVSGTYTDTVRTPRSKRCDSVTAFSLHLTIKQPPQKTKDTSACDFIYWKGTTYTTTTNELFKLGTAANGCDSMEYITFRIKKSTYSFDTLVGCGSLQYDNVTFNGTTDYTANPTRNRVGCDSIVKVRIVIYRTYIKDSMATACDSFSWNELTYTHTGTYSFNQKTIRNCDSTINLYLTIKNSQHDEVTKEECEFISYNHKDYDHSGIYMDTLDPTPDGCLHTVSLRLTVYPASNIYLDTHVCDSFLWHGTTYRSNGEGSFHSQTPNQYGCDSNEYLKVNITESSSSRVPITACESYLWFDSIFTESTNYTHHTKNHVGCDSAIMLRLTIRNNDTTDTTVQACNFFRWHNKVYTHSGTDTIVLNDGNCVMVDVLNLTLGEDTRKEFNKTVCDSFNLVWLDRDSIWHDSTYRMSTTTTRYLHSVLGCDSVVTMNLDVRRSTFSDVYAIECNRYRWHDSIYTQSTDNAQFKRYNRAGCDSVVTLHLDIHYSTDINDTVWGCDTFRWKGQPFYSSRQLDAHRGHTSFGCDSTYVLTLQMLYSNREYYDTIVACNRYVWIDDSTYTKDTTVILHLTDTLYSQRIIRSPYEHDKIMVLDETDPCTCAYTHTLLLTMNYDTYQHDTVKACNQYLWHKNDTLDTLYYSDRTTYSKDSSLTLNDKGCIHHHTLNLTLHSNKEKYLDTTVCDTLKLPGFTITSEIEDEKFIAGKTIHGCDSTLIISLHIENKYSQSTLTACDSFTLKGKTYTASRTLFDTIPIGKCDSIQTIRLQIDHTSLALEEIASCDSFTWRNGVTYHATCGDIDTVHFPDACDSVYILLLTINSKVITEKEITTNEPYEWNNIRYSGSGTYYQMFQSANGCDSIATLNIFFTPFPTPKIYNHSNRVVMVNHYPYGEHSARVDYYGYRWYVNGTLVDGANDDNLALSNSRGINGCITMEAAVDEEQEHWLASNMICFGYVGINDFAEEGSVVFNVYPNPTTSGSMVSISTNLTEPQLVGATLSLFDRQGRELFSIPYAQAQTALTLRQPTGLYLLQIRTADGKTHATKVLVR